MGAVVRLKRKMGTVGQLQLKAGATDIVEDDWTLTFTEVSSGERMKQEGMVE